MLLQNNTHAYMHERMNAISHIRKNLLNVTQGAMADIAGVQQATISRWESGELSPSLEQMRRIRCALIERDIRWSDAWFFDVPEAAE
jgi:predicted transcriptional regulator